MSACDPYLINIIKTAKVAEGVEVRLQFGEKDDFS